MGLFNMFDLGPNHPIRAAFYRHGVHCATHQIRVIIISCALMCILLYPALATHYSSQPLSHFSTKMLDSFLPPNTPATAFRTDVRHIWEGHDIFQVREDAAALAKCGTERTIRIERVIVPSTAPDPRGALNKYTLLATLELQEKISAMLADNDFTDSASCIRDAKGKCLFLSPLEFWHNDPQAIEADTKLARTVNFGPNITLSGIPLHATTTLAGRASDPHSGKTTYAADFLVLTYFFPEVMCHDNFGHSLWRRGLEHATAGFASISHTAYRPQLLALEHSMPAPNMPSASLAIYVVYFIAMAYLAAPLWRMRSVHSRLGLAFTAFVELLASTVMSISVCVMWGWRVTMVPWTVLPAVIVIVGTENMWHLLTALNTTPLTLPVKERVGIAMSQAGTANTMELIAYNALLGTIASFTIGAVRQFCVFGMVVLIVHWFMIHTFWITVLSIDAQRLELEELLRQEPEGMYGRGGSTHHSGSQTKSDQHSKFYKLVGPVLRFMRRHYAINSTLLMFVGLMVGLYLKYPFASKQSQVRYAITHGIISPSAPEPLLPVSPTPDIAEASPWFDPAERFWNLINPTNQALVHVRIETPTIVQLKPISPDSKIYPDQGPLSRFFYNIFRPGLWMIKIMVLPIGATMGLLWGFLAYLLKDADVLEAQRNKPPACLRQANKIGKDSIGDNVQLSILPRNLGSDVDLIASNMDGDIVVSLSIDNELVCWALLPDGQCSASWDLLSHLPSHVSLISTITSIAVSSKGDVCAAGTKTGSIFLWCLSGARPEPLRTLSASSAVSSLAFPAAHWANTHGGRNSTSSLDIAVEPSILVAACEDGSSRQWDVADGTELCVVVPACDSHGHTRVVSEDHGSQILHAVVFRLDGSLQLLRRDSSSSAWAQSCSIHPQPHDQATQHIAFRTLQLAEAARTVVATSSTSGDISIWDAEDGTLLHSTASAGAVHKLAISSMSLRRCPHCGELPMPGFFVCAGIEDSVRVLRATLPLGGKRCSCLHDYSLTVPGLTSSENGSEDSPKGSLDGSLPPPSPPKRQLSYNSLPAAHERLRKPANGSLRRSPDVRTSLDSTPPSPLRLSADGPQSRTSSDQARGFWYGLRVQTLPEIDCERGAWDLIGHVIAGIRRHRASDPIDVGDTQAPFSHGDATPQTGLTGSDEDGLRTQDLQRWEAWTLDVSELVPIAHAAALSQLKIVMTVTPPGARARSRIYPRLPFTRVTSVAVIAAGSLAAGFGNVIGVIDFTKSTTASVPTTAEEAFSCPIPSARR